MIKGEFLYEPQIGPHDLGAEPILGIAAEEHDSWSPSVPKEVVKSLKDKQVTGRTTINLLLEIVLINFPCSTGETSRTHLRVYYDGEAPLSDAAGDAARICGQYPKVL